MDRLSQVAVGEATLEIRPGCGVPQGSPLSCPLFLVFVDDLLWALLSASWTQQQAFADDLSSGEQALSDLGRFTLGSEKPLD